MASLRDIRNRINSIRNTQQVTRAMKMVSAAKLRRAQERIFRTRPYAFRLSEIISHLRDQLDPTSHDLFRERESVNGVLFVVVTSDRGLAGAFNSNIIKE
ncbi:MAG: F0F1 ATP synthase subunit gamma, partial [Rhodothermales bacterium]